MESFRLLVGIQLILSVLILNESRTCIAQGLKTATTTVKCSRKHSAVLTEFGGVGDGVTSNTKAFKAAIDHLRPLASDGGAQLIVPPGKWLTGSFNLTSNFTLFLHKDAVILASQEESEYPILEPLPSYGLEKNSTGRFSSLIMGTNLTDVVITGNNGTIDGQGKPWWTKFKARELNAVRPLIIEILFSRDIQIFNLTLLNSPFWFVHPVYSSNIIVQGLTILAPIDIPNTDGINPDSCSNTRIEDCFIVSGDDCIAIKSGFDQYGIKMGMPSEHIIIRRLTCISPDSATIALGSEMSGGIKDIRAEDVTAIDTQAALRIKTAPGRGGYIKDIFTRRFILKTMQFVFRVNEFYKTHAEGYDPTLLSDVSNINCRDMVAENVTVAAEYEVLPGNTFTGICISNTTMTLFPDLKTSFKVETWDLLPHNSNNIIDCSYPQDKLPIEDVPLKTCSL
ncbi:probable polygalacturonase [Cannabis sativa]|uniref:probable polygalacturonase n=1 Tax=Cannabis sativa TaxID=3483 RepID=UPI0029CA42F6|nr:probable polygalacturonase [Cannabis sativa]